MHLCGLFCYCEMIELSRCAQTLRKCNPTYYKMVHFELARYIHIARQAGFPLIEKYAKTMSTDGKVCSAMPQSKGHHKRSKTEGAASPASPFQLGKMEFEQR